MTHQSLEVLHQQDIFTGGTDGYHTYRIPCLLATTRGTLLAFCEGRRHHRSDSGEIDLLVKRSFDDGRTWQQQQVIISGGGDTCGNPCPVVDRISGRIWLPFTRNIGSDSEKAIVEGTSQGTRTVWITYSDDDGATWHQPSEITGQVKASDWTWYATGPGVGVQLKGGRLLIPCDHIVSGTKEYFSHIIYSDDHGQSWHLGATVGPQANECQAVELSYGSVMLNMRSYRGQGCRLVSFSHDGGQSFTPPTPARHLPEPTCQAALLSRASNKTSEKHTLFFSNPASHTRTNMTVKVSYDDGQTWSLFRVLYSGPTAYSCLAALPNNTIGCLYERGLNSPYERITLAHLELIGESNSDLNDNIG